MDFLFDIKVKGIGRCEIRERKSFEKMYDNRVEVVEIGVNKNIPAFKKSTMQHVYHRKAKIDFDWAHNIIYTDSNVVDADD